MKTIVILLRLARIGASQKLVHLWCFDYCSIPFARFQRRLFALIGQVCTGYSLRILFFKINKCGVISPVIQQPTRSARNKLPSAGRNDLNIRVKRLNFHQHQM